MSEAGNRSVRVQDDADLRLPRAPGVIRRFWARHPLFADIVIAAFCLLFSLGGATATRSATVGGHPLPLPVDVAGSVTIGVLILAACGTLLLRRRMPLVPFALAVALQLVSLNASGAAAGATLLVTTYSLAVYRSNRLCGIAAGGATLLVGVGAGVLALVTAPETALGAALTAAVNTGVLVLVASLVGVNVGNRKRYLEAVLDRSRRLLVERDQQAELAAAAERERIAREMHDIVSHSLTVIVALSEGAAATDDRDGARTASAAAAQTARDALGEMRAMLGVLRGDDGVALSPAAPVSPFDVVAAGQRTGYPATLFVTGDEGAADAAVVFAVGRLVQEGVTNALRHAPAATACTVRVAYGIRDVTVRIDNDGVADAAPTTPGGFGLRGLGERARRLGGEVTARPVSAHAWRLSARIPYATPSDPPTPTARGQEQP